MKQSKQGKVAIDERRLEDKRAQDEAEHVARMVQHQQASAEVIKARQQLNEQQV
jgi:ABC-type uncharacterized transport system ATPase component